MSAVRRFQPDDEVQRPGAVSQSKAHPYKAALYRPCLLEAQMSLAGFSFIFALDFLHESQ
jgi:hypothetical protein